MNIQTKQQGFTLIELLVIIAIIGVLIAIAFPVSTHVMQQAKTAASTNTVNTISAAINMFNEDHDFFPGQLDLDNDNTDDSWNKSLVAALTGYLPKADGASISGDMKEGFGFRMENRGKVYGPYNGTEKIKTDDSSGAPVFVDSFDNPIYYFRFVDPDPAVPADEYFEGDITQWPGGDSAALLDYATKSGSGLDTVYYRRDFCVITAGLDNNFASDLRSGDTDDITNFDK